MHFSVSELLQGAGHNPALQAVAIVLGTFVLEDAATILAATQAGQGKVALAVALGSLYLGIVLGDLGLYGLGRLAAQFPWAKRWAPKPGMQRTQKWLRTHLVKTVFISRFLPGARLPTYTLCGFVHASFARFAAAAIGATLIWTSLLFALSMKVGAFLMDHLGAWRWVGIAVFVATIVVGGRLAARIAEEQETSRTS
jgi:membrane protein DedA with SNARE-associated domain